MGRPNIQCEFFSYLLAIARLAATVAQRRTAPHTPDERTSLAFPSINFRSPSFLLSKSSAQLGLMISPFSSLGYTIRVSKR